jgi:photosystem II stability/assembly factor-like uncharacterized protein
LLLIVAGALLGAAAPARALTPVFLISPDLWQFRNPTPSRNELISVTMPTATDAWAVTRLGEIFASDDGGRNWWLQRSTGKEYFRSVLFRNANRGWVVGSDGAMRRTTNGGATWTTVNTGTSEALLHVFFTSATTGWAVGGSHTLLKSTDGGATWTPQANPAAGTIVSVYFFDADHGWIGDNMNGGICRTTDGGAHWTRVADAAPFATRDLDFVSANRGWAVGANGRVYTTTDGGESWVRRDATYADNLSTVDFTDALNGWVCEEYGNLWHTTDGGVHWTEVAPGGDFAALAMADAQHICIVGADTDWTRNGGIDWLRSSRDVTHATLSEVSFDAGGHGWAVGVDGIIVGTDDGGRTWAAEHSPIAASHLDVSAVSATRAFAVGVDWAASDHASYIISTSDGGATWTTLGTYPDEWLECVDFVDSSHGWVGGPQSLRRTTDGGAHWTSLVDVDARDLDFVTTTRGWAADDWGRVRRTIDGGSHWTIVETPLVGPNPLRISFADTSNGWAIQKVTGAIIHTVDGGVSWETQKAGGPNSRWDIAAATAKRAWAVSEGGVILRTTNGGVTWIQQNSHTSDHLLAVTVADGGIWAVGDSGTILSRDYKPAPHVVRRTPSAVRRGKWVTIYGWGFGTARTASSYVKIGSKKVAAYAFWHDMRIKVKAPKVKVGRRTLKIVVGGKAANTLKVRVKR